MRETRGCRTLLPPALALAGLALTACSSPGAPSEPDERLGTLMLAIDGRDAHLSGSRGEVSFYFADHIVDTSGNIHLVAAHRTTREFGKGGWTESKAYYRVADVSGAVRGLVPPPLAWPAIGEASLVLAHQTQQPVLLFEGKLPGGRLLTLHLFDGVLWRRVDFLRKDRAPLDDATGFSQGAGQVRVLSADALVIQHGDRLTRWSEGRWTPIGLPAGARTIRLGHFGATGLRAWWLNGRGELATDLLETSSWTWRGKPARFPGAGLSFGSSLRHSGTGDIFTLQLDTADRRLLVLRYSEGLGFRVVPPGPAQGADGGAPGGGELLTSQHPYRTLEYNPATADLFANYEGVQSGLVGNVHPSKAAITCAEAPRCATSDGGRIFEGPDCKKCYPRLVKLGEIKLLPNVDGVTVLQTDVPDAITRLYVKRIGLPMPAETDGFNQRSFAPGAFPGDDGGLPLEDPSRVASLLQITGKALLLGAVDHRGTRITLRQADVEAHETPMTVVQTTDEAGAYSFSNIRTGAWTIEATHADYLPWSASIAPTAAGATSLSPGVLRPVGAGIPDRFDPTLAADHTEFHDALLQWGGSSGQVQISHATGVWKLAWTGLAPGTRPVYRSRVGLAWNTGTCPGSSCGLSTEPVSPPVTGVVAGDLRGRGAFWVYPDGPVDGVTTRAWRTQSGSSWREWLTAIDVETYTTGLTAAPSCWGYAWRDVSGAVEVSYLPGACLESPPSSPITTATPLPVLRARAVHPLAHALAMTGYDAPDCGAAGAWRTGCKLYFLLPESGDKLSDSGIAAALSPAEEIFFLEQLTPGGPGTLARRRSGEASTVIATGLQLPRWTIGDLPLVVLQSGDAVLRDGAALVRYARADNARRVLFEHGVSMHPVRIDTTTKGVLLHHRSTSGTSCGDHRCGLSLLNLSTGELTALMADGANGNEQYFRGRLLTERPWADCPGAPCLVVTDVSNAAVPKAIARGTLWPNRAASWIPYETGLFMLEQTEAGELPLKL